MLKHPDGPEQLEVIGNSISIDYVVHHWLAGWLGMLPSLLQMQLNYPFEEVNHIHVTSQSHFEATKRFFFHKK